MNLQKRVALSRNFVEYKNEKGISFEKPNKKSSTQNALHRFVHRRFARPRSIVEIRRVGRSLAPIQRDLQEKLFGRRWRNPTVKENLLDFHRNSSICFLWKNATVSRCSKAISISSTNTTSEPTTVYIRSRWSWINSLIWWGKSKDTSMQRQSWRNFCFSLGTELRRIQENDARWSSSRRETSNESKKLRTDRKPGNSCGHRFDDEKSESIVLIFSLRFRLEKKRSRDNSYREPRPVWLVLGFHGDRISRRTTFHQNWKSCSTFSPESNGLFNQFWKCRLQRRLHGLCISIHKSQQRHRHGSFLSLWSPRRQMSFHSIECRSNRQCP